MDRIQTMQTTMTTTAPDKAKKEMFLVLEGIRGLCAILVAMRHMGGFAVPVSFPMSYVAVDMFFLLSGFVIAYSYEPKLLGRGMTLRQYMELRVLRVYPLYVVGSALGMVAYLLSGEESLWKLLLIVPLAALFVPVMLPKFTLFRLNHPSWSLFFELVMNYLYAKWMVHMPRVKVIGIMAASLLLMAVVAFAYKRNLDVGYALKHMLMGFPRVVFSFMFGVLIYRDYVARQPVKTYGNMMALVLSAAVVAVLAAPIGYGVMGGAFALVAIAGIFPLIVYLGVRTKVTNGILAWALTVLGVVSYPLYVLHAPTYEMIKALAVRGVDWAVTLTVLPYGSVSVLAALVAIAYAVDIYADVPVRRWLRSRFVGK